MPEYEYCVTWWFTSTISRQPDSNSKVYTELHAAEHMYDYCVRLTRYSRVTLERRQILQWEALMEFPSV